MAPPRKLLNLYMSEVFRYRLALDDQMQRIVLAKQLLRAKPDSLPWERVTDPNTAEKWRTMNEVQFLFAAIRGICYMADAMEAAADEHQFADMAAAIRAAKAGFEAEAPHAVDMRDFLTHLDRYMAGLGYKELPEPDLQVWIVTPEDDLGLCVGGVVVTVVRTVEAANRLAVALRDALGAVEDAEVTLTGDAGTVAHTTELTDAQRDILRAVDLKPPPRITHLDPT